MFSLAGIENDRSSVSVAPHIHHRVRCRLRPPIDDVSRPLRGKGDNVRFVWYWLTALSHRPLLKNKVLHLKMSV